LSVWIILTTVVLATSLYGVRALEQWAWRRNLLAIPNDRASHTHPTPRGGGLVIFLVTIISWLAYLTFSSSQTIDSSILGYLVGALSIAAISWRDDVRSLPYWMRFAVHVGAALLPLSLVGYWSDIALPLRGMIELGWFGLPLTFFWIVGLTNAYNFMDGIDGLAGGQAMIAALGWLLLAWYLGQPLIAVLALFLTAATAGFLWFNWSPARIFMGDVGSAFLGYTFAVLPLLLSTSEHRLPFAALVLVWPFVFDTGFTFLRRVRRREKIFEAHRSHLYQRLVISGLPHQTVTLLYLALALLNVLLSLWWVISVQPTIQGLVVALLIGESYLLWRLVRHYEAQAVQAHA
jgi:UDP-N-acetylmuramyl pentapeptide phosphotransferase/UDP-N-acetylglucosamine-1-phosphate transferase